MSLNSNQPNLPRAITVRQTVAEMKSRRGPLVQHFNMPLDRGRTFRWVLDENTLVADDLAVIEGSGQGNVGRWVLIREPVDGADLANLASQSIDVGGDFWRVMPTIGQTSTVTLATTNAERGDIITLTRTDASAFTLAIINGGPAAGTLVTFPVSLQGFGDFYFDGTNWLKMRAATMLA